MLSLHYGMCPMGLGEVRAHDLMELTIDDTQDLQVHTGAHLLCAACFSSAWWRERCPGGITCPCLCCCHPCTELGVGCAASCRSSWASHCSDTASPLPAVRKVRGTCLSDRCQCDSRVCLRMPRSLMGSSCPSWEQHRQGHVVPPGHLPLFPWPLLSPT